MEKLRISSNHSEKIIKKPICFKTVIDEDGSGAELLSLRRIKLKAETLR